MYINSLKKHRFGLIIIIWFVINTIVLFISNKEIIEIETRKLTTVEEFAQIARDEYPGRWDDISDKDIIKIILERSPDLADYIEGYSSYPKTLTYSADSYNYPFESLDLNAYDYTEFLIYTSISIVLFILLLVFRSTVLKRLIKDRYFWIMAYLIYSLLWFGDLTEVIPLFGGHTDFGELMFFLITPIIVYAIYKVLKKMKKNYKNNNV